MFAGALNCRMDFLLPGSMGSITDVVGFHNKRVAHHTDRCGFHIHYRLWISVRIIRSQAQILRWKLNRVFGVSHEEAVTTYRNRNMHIRLLCDNETLQNKIK